VTHTVTWFNHVTIDSNLRPYKGSEADCFEITSKKGLEHAREDKQPSQRLTPSKRISPQGSCTPTNASYTEAIEPTTIPLLPILSPHHRSVPALSCGKRRQSLHRGTPSLGFIPQPKHYPALTTMSKGFPPPLTPLAPPGSALLGGAGTEEGKNERNKGEALAHFPISHMRPQNREELNIKPFIQKIARHA
jgi:hypothetical protein